MLRTVKKDKATKVGGPAKASNAKGQPSLEEFIVKRDYTGALTLLEFRLKCQDGDAKDLLLWIGYCAFHIGNYKRAEEAYRELLTAHDVSRMVHLYIACCYFFQQMYEEAEREAEQAPEDSLKTRILFHCAHRVSDENKLMTQHQKLHETKMDFLSLAAVHFLRSHFHDVSWTPMGVGRAVWRVDASERLTDCVYVCTCVLVS
jgi:intraflagellar transport protein 56